MMFLAMMRMRRSEGIMYDPKYWKRSNGITVKQFCDYLREHIPPDAVMNVCGSDKIYIHLEKDGSMFSVDDCSLSDSPEYVTCWYRIICRQDRMWAYHRVSYDV